VTMEQTDVDLFHRDGFLLLKNFYDLKKDIEPIQQGIHGILRLISEKYGLPRPDPFSPDIFDRSYAPLIAKDRRIGGEVYDAVKQIPAFQRLVSLDRHDEIFRHLRETELSGIASGGSGIRIDNPNEERFRADWHQEYPAQFRSPDGIVFWSPLVPIVQAMGPVRICVGSHRDGLRRVHLGDPKHPEKIGAYGLTLEHRDEIIESYTQIAPLALPGDLLLMDFMTLHASGTNVGDRSRWSMQFRYFNFAHPEGVERGWPGAYAEGKGVREIRPDLVVDWPKES
jgi:Phytanoyl-CoA dioxygenase (PhyH)